MVVKRRLYPDECLELLRSVPIGRVIFSTGALPTVSPVHFALHDESVVFWALAESRLAKVTHRNIVAFQADSYDPIERSGWSVLGVGVAIKLDVANDPQPPPQSIPEPWAIEDADQHLMRIDLDQLSGNWLG
jgi:hypothetical protein